MGSVATSEKPNVDSQDVVCATEELNSLMLSNRGAILGIIKLEMISVC